MSIGKIVGIGAAVVVGLPIAALLVNLVTAPARVANMAVNSATGVASKTLDPNNVITKYEWFHDANAAFETRVRQIQTQHKAVSDETDPRERSMLANEMRGMQGVCLKLANDYNANATKTNVSIFQGREAPERLDPNKCN